MEIDPGYIILIPNECIAKYASIWQGNVEIQIGIVLLPLFDGVSESRTRFLVSSLNL